MKTQSFRALKNGRLQIAFTGYIAPDGAIFAHTTDGTLPIISRAACERLGIDPKAAQKSAAPRECLCGLGDNEGGITIRTADDYEAEESAKRQAQARREAEELEAAIPGITKLAELQRRARDEHDRYDRQFREMMDDEYNDGARPPRRIDASLAEELREFAAAHPQAALYLRAKRQAEGTTSYSATSGAMRGGREAMAILRRGGTPEEAEKALAFRYDDRGLD